MATEGYMRVSDDDRERIVGILREQTAEGRLTLEEFEERMGAAYAAKTWDDLLPLTRDLPVDVGFPREESRPRPSRGSAAPTGAPVLREGASSYRLARLAPLLVCPAIFLIIAVVAGDGGPAVFPFIIGGFVWFWMLSGRRCGPVRPGGGRGPGG